MRKRKFKMEPTVDYAWFFQDDGYAPDAWSSGIKCGDLKMIYRYKPAEKAGRTIKLVRETTTYEEIE